MNHETLEIIRGTPFRLRYNFGRRGSPGLLLKRSTIIRTYHYEGSTFKKDRITLRYHGLMVEILGDDLLKAKSSFTIFVSIDERVIKESTRRYFTWEKLITFLNDLHEMYCYNPINTLGISVPLTPEEWDMVTRVSKRIKNDELRCAFKAVRSINS